MNEEVVIMLSFVLITLSGVVVLLASMSNRQKMREMAHRERVAMIERGLIPSPERDPARFEAAASLRPTATGPQARRADRFRTAGVLMIGLGLGLLILISFVADSPSVGIGIGGAWMALGAAALLNYFLTARDAEFEMRPPAWSSPLPPPADPPGNVAP